MKVKLLKNCVLSAGKTGQKDKTADVSEDTAKKLVASQSAVIVPVKVTKAKPSADAQDDGSGE